MSKEIVPRLIQLDQPEWEMEAEQPVMFKERPRRLASTG